MFGLLLDLEQRTTGHRVVMVVVVVVVVVVLVVYEMEEDGSKSEGVPW